MEERNVCVLWGWRFPNPFYIMSETPYSFETVERELEQVILCLLLCLETDWEIRFAKKGCVYFN